MFKRGKRQLRNSRLTGFYRSYTSKRRLVIISSVLLLLMIYLFKDASWYLRTVTTVGFLMFFYITDHTFDIRFTSKHYLFVFIIAIASFMLSPLYYIYPNYDKVQHFIQPIFVSSIIFYMISNLAIERKWKITLTFFVTIGLLGLFEIGEYSLDHFFDLKLQGVYLRDFNGLEKFNLVMNRIDDTMVDMVLGVIGSSLYCAWQFFAGRKKY